MRTVLSHGSPDYRCSMPGCSYTGINIIEKREFTPDRTEEESDKREDISTDSDSEESDNDKREFTPNRPEDESDKRKDTSSDNGERNEIEQENNIGRVEEKGERLKNKDKDTDKVDTEGCLTKIFRQLCCRGPES